MKKTAISDDIRDQMDLRIKTFNEKQKCCYTSSFKGKFMYLEQWKSGLKNPVCRLKFNGQIDDWEFAIFKWSNETYDSNEMFFPGSECVDVSVEGAMKAGLLAYPV